MDIKEIRYINLGKNISKRVLMELLLRIQKYPVKRVEGVLWNEENNEYQDFLKNGLEDYVKKESISRQQGVVGCWIAHTNALNGIDHHDGIIVVLEDDFVCKHDFFEDALSMIRGFDRDFDVIFFDPSGSGPKSDHLVKPGIYDPKGHTYPDYFGAHCLFINSRSISKILKAKEESQIMDYDGFLLCNQGIKSYVFYTGKSSSVWLGSDISGLRGPLISLYGMIMWFDFRRSSDLFVGLRH